jgi:DNA-binding SARP family transcriptional activator
LFGKPEFFLNGHKMPMNGKPAALMALLCFGKQPRSQAERLLWGRDAAHNLRQAIYSIKKLEQSSDWFVAADQLELYATTDLEPPSEAAELLRHLEQPLLANMDDSFSDEGLEWLVLEREKALIRLRQHLFALAREQENPALLERLLQLDPLHESAAQLLMRLHLEAGVRDLALAVYGRLRSALQQELGTEPLPETGAILDGSVVLSAPERLRFERAYAVIGSLEPRLIAALLERDELEVAEVLSGLELDVANIRAKTPPAVWQLLSRRAAQIHPDPERSAQHWLEAQETEQAAAKYLEAAQTAVARYLLPQAAPLALRVVWLEPELPKRCQALLILTQWARIKGDVLWHSDLLADLERSAFALQDNKILTLFELEAVAMKNITGDAAEAETRALEALRYAKLCQDTWLEQAATFALVEVWTRRHRVKETEQMLAQFSVESPDVLLQKAGVHRTLGEYQPSIDLTEQAIVLLRHQGNLDLLSVALNDLGVSYEFAYQMDKAYAVHQEALRVKGLRNEWLNQSTSLGNIAKLHIRAGRLGLGYNTACEGLELANQRGLLQSQAANNLWLGEVCYRIGDHQRAEQYLETGFAFAQQNGNLRWMAAIRLNILINQMLWGHADGAEILQFGQDLYQKGYVHNAFLAYAITAQMTTSPDVLLQAWAFVRQYPHPQIWYLQSFVRARLALFGLPEGDSNPEALRPALEWQELVEQPLLYTAQAELYQRQYQDELAEAALEQAAQARAKQAEGLPKALRDVYLSGAQQPK